jgi:hypothetical protein
MPARTSSTMPARTSSTMPARTSSTMPERTSSTMPERTSSTMPERTSSTQDNRDYLDSSMKSDQMAKSSEFGQITTDFVNNMKSPVINLGVVYSLQYLGNKAAPTIFRGELSHQIVLNSVAKSAISSTVVPKICNLVKSSLTGQLACQMVGSIGTSIAMDNSLEKSMNREAIDSANKNFDTKLLEARLVQLENAAKIPTDMKTAMNSMIDIFIDAFSAVSDKYTFKRNEKSGMALFLEKTKICEIHVGNNLVVSISDDISKLKSFSKYLTINMYRTLEGMEVQIRDRLSNKIADESLRSQLDDNIKIVIDYIEQLMMQIIQ